MELALFSTEALVKSCVPVRVSGPVVVLVAFIWLSWAAAAVAATAAAAISRDSASRTQTEGSRDGMREMVGRGPNTAAMGLDGVEASGAMTGTLRGAGATGVGVDAITGAASTTSVGEGTREKVRPTAAPNSHGSMEG